MQLQQRYQKITPLTLVGEVKKEELVRTEETRYLNHKNNNKRTPSLMNLSCTPRSERSFSYFITNLFGSSWYKNQIILPPGRHDIKPNTQPAPKLL